MIVVIDTNVAVSAIFWPGEDRHCFVLGARKRFRFAVTLAILTEYEEISERMATDYPKVNPGPWLSWIRNKALLVEPSPLGKQRSKDLTDDIFLGCALAVGADAIVSKDRHLLNLGKPFGVEMLTPRQLIKRLT